MSLYFMSVLSDQSFEERRLHDYRSAYQSTALFVPTAIPVPADALPDPDPLPAFHDFRPTKSTASTDVFESISAQALYAHYCHEELRYLAGHKRPPPTDAMDGDTATSDPRSTASPALTGSTPDTLMSIVASHRFEKHSFEELRIAYLLAGKEVGSSEIPTRGALPAQSAPTLFARPRGDAFSAGSPKLV